MRTFRREILTIIIIAVVIFIISRTAVQSFVVVGASMEPNFEQGQRLLINKVAYHLRVGDKIIYYFREPQRGDVIVFRHSQSADYIKRIIALPSDTIELKGKTIYIDGYELYESYINGHPSYDRYQKKIPENEYFVLGDNRDNSNDSRNGWTVKDKDMIGKAWLSIWPPSQWGLVPHYPLQEQLPSTKLLPQLP